MEKARMEAVVLQARLDLPSETKRVTTLLDICLLCGGKQRPNRVCEATENIWEEEADSEEVMDEHLTELGEYMWLEGCSIQQAMDKVARFARVNHASLSVTLEVLSTLAHERYRAQGGN